MNIKIILALGIPITIRNKVGQRATIELNKNRFVICRYHPNNSFYISDLCLENWYPTNIIKLIIYKIRIHRSRSKTGV